MAEVIVVSAIVLSVIGGLFISYNRIYGAYNTRVGYYDTVTLYRLEYYRNILIENDVMNDILEKTKKTETIVNIYDSDNNSNNIFTLPSNEISNSVTDKVLLIQNTADSIRTILGSESNYNVSATFKDYLKYLSTSVEINSNFFMVMERCELQEKNGKKKNIDKCKYAYLEVYDGTETTKS